MISIYPFVLHVQVWYHAARGLVRKHLFIVFVSIDDHECFLMGGRLAMGVICIHRCIHLLVGT